MSITAQKDTLRSNAPVISRNIVSESDICTILVGALAEVKGEARSDLDSQLDSSGDLRTDSSEAEVIIVALEEQLGCRLPGPSKLRAEQFASVKSLANMAVRNL